MAEEWQLSAHDTAKRIMLRQCMQDAARMVRENNSSQIYIHNWEGIGQSMALLTPIVISARMFVQIWNITLMIEEAFEEYKEFEATIKEGENQNKIIKCY